MSEHSHFWVTLSVAFYGGPQKNTSGGLMSVMAVISLLLLTNIGGQYTLSLVREKKCEDLSKVISTVSFCACWCVCKYCIMFVSVNILPGLCLCGTSSGSTCLIWWRDHQWWWWWRGKYVLLFLLFLSEIILISDSLNILSSAAWSQNIRIGWNAIDCFDDDNN